MFVLKLADKRLGRNVREFSKAKINMKPFAIRKVLHQELQKFHLEYLPQYLVLGYPFIRIFFSDKMLELINVMSQLIKKFY